MRELINLENGIFYFGNQEFVTPKTTFDQVKQMKGKIDSSTDIADYLAYYNKEIDGRFYQISVHFHCNRLQMIFVTYKEGALILETKMWEQLKLHKTNKYSKKGDYSKSKNFEWGSISAFYSQKVDLGSFNISYKKHI